LPGSPKRGPETTGLGLSRSGIRTSPTSTTISAHAPTSSEARRRARNDRWTRRRLAAYAAIIVVSAGGKPHVFLRAQNACPCRMVVRESSRQRFHFRIHRRGSGLFCEFLCRPAERQNARSRIAWSSVWVQRRMVVSSAQDAYAAIAQCPAPCAIVESSGGQMYRDCQGMRSTVLRFCSASVWPVARKRTSGRRLHSRPRHGKVRPDCHCVPDSCSPRYRRATALGSDKHNRAAPAKDRTHRATRPGDTRYCIRPPSVPAGVRYDWSGPSNTHFATTSLIVVRFGGYIVRWHIPVSLSAGTGESWPGHDRAVRRRRRVRRGTGQAPPVPARAVAFTVGRSRMRVGVAGIPVARNLVRFAVVEASIFLDTWHKRGADRKVRRRLAGGFFAQSESRCV